MKKEAYFLLLILFCMLFLFGCKTNTDSEPYAVKIVDRTKTEDIGTCDELEIFWKDDTYYYYFPSIKSKYVIVNMSNGKKIPVKEALAQGIITISDLDAYDIHYYQKLLE